LDRGLVISGRFWNSVTSVVLTACPLQSTAQTHSGHTKTKMGDSDIEIVTEVKQITVTVKTPKEKQQVEIEENASVKQFKTAISGKFGNAAVENLCLIFAGKIMKDHETLAVHHVKDGMTVHLVIKQAGGGASASASSPSPPPATPPPAAASPGIAPPSRPPQAPADISATPFGMGGLGGLAGLGNLGMGSANFMEMQQRMQRDLLANPDMLRQVLDNPLTQSLMTNPDVIRQMLESNPQMQEVMDRNPEIRQMLNNPDVLRQMMEIARNPSRLQEMTRTMDRQMQNLESVPGGMNILQRMYRDVQEPVLNAMGPSNPFQALSGANNGATAPSTAENNAPAPNPWAAGGTNALPPTTAAPAGGAAGNSMFTSPGMTSLMQQMSENPTLMSQMMSAPYMQSMFSSLQANPEQASTMLTNNPLFAGNPQMQQQLGAMMPQLLQQMQNPSVQQLMANPEALQAIMQIQQGMDRLRVASPELFSTLGLPSLPPGLIPPGMVPPEVVNQLGRKEDGHTASAVLNQILLNHPNIGIPNNYNGKKIVRQTNPMPQDQREARLHKERLRSQTVELDQSQDNVDEPNQQ